MGDQTVFSRQKIQKMYENVLGIQSYTYITTYLLYDVDMDTCKYIYIL